MGQMNQNISRQLNDLPARLPPPGRAVFLAEGQTLATRASTWGQAVAQRGEWALVMHAVGNATRVAAVGTIEFGHNYGAMIWSALECDIIAGNGEFLRGFNASGELISDPKQRQALEFLGTLRATP